MRNRWILIGFIWIIGVICFQTALPQDKAEVKHPCLMADAGEIAQAREWMKKYNWYREWFLKEKESIDKFMANPIYVSPLKQEWSYDSYNCPKDNESLEYDETKPLEHRCPKCGNVYSDHKYNATWAGRYNGSLGRRVKWLGTIYQMTGEEKYAQAARDILVKFAELYLKFPNKNNILGPARVFFGTLGESVWTVDMASGYDLVYNSPTFSPQDHRMIKEKLFYPLSEIVQQFPETVSNRQLVYNNAVAAIGFLYGDSKLIDIALNGQYGYKYQLRVGMSRDGFWSEGSAYHFFSLFSFCTFAEMARHHGLDYYNMKIADHWLKHMFDAPFNIISPDYQFPRTRDSGGGFIINQTDWYEVGYARYGDQRYVRFLNYAYKKNGNKRNSLFFFAINPELPNIEGEIYPENSFNFDENGFAVLRDKVDDDRKYLYLDYGVVGGEHGHPDRLSIGYYAQGAHWLIDPKNEDYFRPNLQTWYRQTIAHNTMVVNETKQTWANGYYKFFGETPGFKVASGGADQLYGGVKMTRTVVLVGDYFLDIFDVAAPEVRTYDLPYHSLGTLSAEGVELEKQPLDLFGHQPGIQGYDLLTQVKKGTTHNDWRATFRKDNGTGLALIMLGSQDTTVYTAMRPGIGGAYNVKSPMVMSRRVIPSTRFESLIEAFKDKPNVTSFTRGSGNNTYKVYAGGEEHLITLDLARAKYYLIKKKEGKIKQISSFNNNILNEGNNRLFSSDFALDYVDIIYGVDEIRVTAPDDFGCLKIYAPNVKRIIVNNREIGFKQEGDYCVIIQEDKEIIAKLIEPNQNRIFLGMNNKITAGFYNYTGKPAMITSGLKLADGWEEKIQAQMDYWGGIVNLVPTNKSDIRKVISPQRPESLSPEWANKIDAKVINIEPGLCGVSEFTVTPKIDQAVAGRYEFVPVWKDNDKNKEGETFVIEAVEPVTVDLMLPNGKSNTLAVTLQNNTTAEVTVDMEIKLSEWWKITGEAQAQVKIPAGSAIVHEVTARLVGYREDEQLYPVEVSCKCGGFNTTIRKDFYVGFCHWTEKAPSLTGSFKDWNTSAPITIDKQNQVARLLGGTEPWLGKNDLSAKIYAMYDTDNLYVGCEVQDDTIVENFDPRMRWPFDPDSLEIIFDTRTNSEQGADPLTEGTFRHLALLEYRAVRFDPSMPGDLPMWFRQIPDAQTFYKKTDKGYNIMVRIPFRILPLVVPKEGSKIGFDISLNDNDGTLYRKNELIWAGYNQNQSWLDFRLIGALIFRKP